MTQPSRLESAKQTGAGLAFIAFPLIFTFAFAAHPGLLHPHLAGPEELVRRALHSPTLQLGHALVTLNTGLLVVAALHFMKRLEQSQAAGLGFVGGALAIAGALTLAADKGALCLTLSALDGLPPAELQAMMPGLLAIFAKQGWLVLLWGIVLLPLGFALQAVALLRARTLPQWQGTCFLLAVLFIAAPDGMEIVNLSASVLMTIGLLPYGLRLLRQPVMPTDA